LRSYPGNGIKGFDEACRKVAGTSSGAIVALLVSLGYSGGEIEKLIGGTNFKIQ
jgi:hypothetical protein